MNARMTPPQFIVGVTTTLFGSVVVYGLLIRYFFGLSTARTVATLAPVLVVELIAGVIGYRRWAAVPENVLRSQDRHLVRDVLAALVALAVFTFVTVALWWQGYRAAALISGIPAGAFGAWFIARYGTGGAGS